MKKLLKVFIVLCLIFSLFSCESNNMIASNENSNAANGTQEVGQIINEKKVNESKEEVKDIDKEAVFNSEKDNKVETNNVLKTVSKETAKTEAGSSDVTESKEEPTPRECLVIFYRHRKGGILQGGSLLLGETPTYNGPTPTYSDDQYLYEFAGWTNSKGEDVNPFKPITGDSLFFAKYNIVGEVAHEPDPNACTRTDNLEYVITARDEDKTVDGYPDWHYTNHVLEIKVFEYRDNGYVCTKPSVFSEGTECDNSKYIGKEGQYVHSDGSICPNPDSHNIH